MPTWWRAANWSRRCRVCSKTRGSATRTCITPGRGATRVASIAPERQHDLIADPDETATLDVGIQGQPPPKSAADIPQHVGVALERVRIDRDHDAPAPERLEPEHCGSDMQPRSFPAPFVQPF